YATPPRKPLEPRYVSTVDSGNLAGHLSVLAVAARERTRRPIVGAEIQRGIDSALVLLREALPADAHAPLDDLRLALAPEPTAFAAGPTRLRELASVVRTRGRRAAGQGAAPRGGRRGRRVGRHRTDDDRVASARPRHGRALDRSARRRAARAAGRRPGSRRRRRAPARRPAAARQSPGAGAHGGAGARRLDRPPARSRPRRGGRRGARGVGAGGRKTPQESRRRGADGARAL